MTRMAERAGRRKFAGKLSKPLVRLYSPRAAGGRPSLHGTQAERLAEAEWIHKELKERFELLLQHYGVSSADAHKYQKLALGLVIDFVPGFRIVAQPSRKRGRPGTWQGTAGLDLVLAVREVQGRRKKGISDAIFQLTRDPNWSGFTKANLETRYHEVRSRLQKDPLMLLFWARGRTAKEK